MGSAPQIPAGTHRNYNNNNSFLGKRKKKEKKRINRFIMLVL